MSDEPELIVIDVLAWRDWLDRHEHASDGVWLVLAKKGVREPTSLTYAQALEEALCSGWIDGQKRGRDVMTFLQRFTPRRRRSLWSLRNIGIVERLIEEDRMRERGHAEIAAARADGRWERAYPGAAAAEAPPDLLEALATSPAALARFESLGSQGRYSVLFPLMPAPDDAVRRRRLERAVKMLERGEG